jgi:hypothetical protein
VTEEVKKEAELGAPDIHIRNQGGEWTADPKDFRVIEGHQQEIVIVGPASPKLEMVWFKDPDHAPKFGARDDPVFFPDKITGRVTLDISSTPVGEYPYSFRIDGENVDPKIIIDPPK